jgi:hypothetical protein
MWNVVPILYVIGGIICAEIFLGLLTAIFCDTGNNPAGAEGAGLVVALIFGCVSALLFYLLSESLGYLPHWPFWVAGGIGLPVIILVIYLSKKNG